ncbi:MAG TPA: nicotinamide mononucleotide transporter [Rhizomicrobium sp.]
MLRRIDPLDVAKWIGTALQIFGCLTLALNIASSAWAFPVMLAGSALCIVASLARRDRALLALNAAYSLTNIVGILRWLA